MIRLVFSDVTFTPDRLVHHAKQAGVEEFERPLGSVLAYPERNMLRGEIREWVEKQILRSNNDELITIMTDSDFILDEFRCQIKEELIPAKEFSLYVYVFAEGFLEPNIDANGRFDFLPELLQFHTSQLRRLL